MKKILLGESGFLFVVQIVFLFVIIFIASFLVVLLVKVQPVNYRLALIMLGLFFSFLYVIWQKLISLNIVVKKNGNAYIKNLIREKELQIKEIHEIRISWLWLHGTLVLKNKRIGIGG